MCWILFPGDCRLQRLARHPGRRRACHPRRRQGRRSAEGERQQRRRRDAPYRVLRLPLPIVAAPALSAPDHQGQVSTAEVTAARQGHVGRLQIGDVSPMMNSRQRGEPGLSRRAKLYLTPLIGLSGVLHSASLELAMPSFRWSAVNPGGDVLSGVMDAPDRSTVVDRLQRQGQIVLRAEPADRLGGWRELLNLDLRGTHSLEKTALMEFTRELAIMLGAGQDLDRALRFVVDHTRSARARTILGNIRDRVRAGSSLAAALATEPRSFSKLYIGLVRAGEAGGSLPTTLERLASLLERERNLTASLRASMVYPALLVCAASGSVAMLLEYVLPQFVPLFQQAGAKLPASTRALMTIGTAIGSGGPWLLAIAVVSAVVAHRLLSQPFYREKADRLLLRLPIVGTLLRETVAARLTRTLGSLLQNGVPLIAALGIAKDALGNLAAAAAVDVAARAAKSGAGLARPLAESGLFPDRTTHLLQLGEEAAQLPAMALKAAEIHDEQARLMMQKLVALAVPLITIVMGLAVAGIVGGLISAMLSLNDLAV